MVRLGKTKPPFERGAVLTPLLSFLFLSLRIATGAVDSWPISFLLGPLGGIYPRLVVEGTTHPDPFSLHRTKRNVRLVPPPNRRRSDPTPGLSLWFRTKTMRPFEADGTRKDPASRREPPRNRAVPLDPAVRASKRHPTSVHLFVHGPSVRNGPRPDARLRLVHRPDAFPKREPSTLSFRFQ